jgi:hypothetical protein
LTRQAHARDSQCHRFAREVEDGNRRGEKGRYSPYNHLSAENCACSAPPACWQLIGSPRGERLGRPRCIRSLAGTKSMARINVTAGSPGAHPCRRSDDFVRPHRHRHVLSFRTVSLLQSPPWRACTRIAPYCQRDGTQSPGRANVGIPTPRIGLHPPPSTAAPTTAEVESAKPTLLPFAIPRCSSLQYGKMLAAR